ncbi:(2Fe-2S)-binding protein [Candidatus Hecatella orcuttiae]|uniref:(2Fe-2S)-binding protein n=1 Tax=Candidatus Hecatella orcuttiae TaxID=1935119 RepID=UPI002868223E|nr:2Fe-2S iron-sulfur cluster-binding protein [Candidatus Hecatella orcuttiae]
MILLATITKKTVKLTVNGVECEVEVDVNEVLAKVLREKLGLTGTKIGCESGECGACTVLIDGQPKLSCLILAIECEGKKILTVEGLSDPETGKLHPIQEAFIENFGFQCGFCTPGFLMVTKALLDKKTGEKLTDEEIRLAIAGNICRCGDYYHIIESIKAAAEKMKRFS